MTHFTLIIISVQSIFMALIIKDCTLEKARINAFEEKQKTALAATLDAKDQMQQIIFKNKRK